jgi:hypothetical protein
MEVNAALGTIVYPSLCCLKMEVKAALGTIISPRDFLLQHARK